MKSTIRPDIPGVRDGDQWGGQVLFYVCAGCNRPRRYLYPWEMIDGRLVHDLSLRCAQCARLRYPCQGGRGPGTTVEPWASSRPSVEPWEPRAVSDPRMIASEFPKLTLHLVGMSRRGLRRRRARQPARDRPDRLLGGRAAGSLLSDQGESGF